MYNLERAIGNRGRLDLGAVQCHTVSLENKHIAGLY